MRDVFFSRVKLFPLVRKLRLMFSVVRSNWLPLVENTSGVLSVESNYLPLKLPFFATNYAIAPWKGSFNVVSSNWLLTQLLNLTSVVADWDKRKRKYINRWQEQKLSPLWSSCLFLWHVYFEQKSS